MGSERPAAAAGGPGGRAGCGLPACRVGHFAVSGRGADGGGLRPICVWAAHGDGDGLDDLCAARAADLDGAGGDRAARAAVAGRGVGRGAVVRERGVSVLQAGGGNEASASEPLRPADR